MVQALRIQSNMWFVVGELLSFFVLGSLGAAPQITAEDNGNLLLDADSVSTRGPLSIGGVDVVAMMNTTNDTLSAVSYTTSLHIQEILNLKGQSTQQNNTIYQQQRTIDGLDSQIRDLRGSVETLTDTVNELLDVLNNGSHSIFGTFCQICGFGEYVSAPCTATSPTQCANCSAGTVSAGGNVQNCTSCTEFDPFCTNFTSCTPSGETTCSACEAGSLGHGYVRSNGQCTYCEIGTVYSASQGRCVSCATADGTCPVDSCAAGSGSLEACLNDVYLYCNAGQDVYTNCVVPLLTPTVAFSFPGTLSLVDEDCYLNAYGGAVGARLPVGRSSYAIDMLIKPAPACRRNGGFISWGVFGQIRRANAFRLAGAPSGVHNYWWGDDLGAQAPGVNLFDGEWHAVATMYDQSSGLHRVAVDGTVIAQRTSTTKNTILGDFCVGKTYGAEYFTGSMRNITVYSTYVPLQALQTV
eukprot:m.295582 g.295582  ORF g.295582 m.295582 type:complete len:468 (+) comp20041_c0_seq1:184-1587(+)